MQTADHSARPLSIRYAAIIGASVASLDWLATELTRHSGHSATMWPAKGMVLAVILLAGSRSLRPVLLAAALGTLIAKLSYGDEFVRSLFMVGVTTACNYAAYRLIRHFIGDIDFRQWKQGLAFILIASLVALFSGVLGAGYLTWDQGANFVSGVFAWWLTGFLSYVIFTPLTMLLLSMRAGSAERKRRLFAAGLLVTVCAIIAFGQSSLPALYLAPIILMIATLIAGLEGMAVGLAICALTIVGCTAANIGPLTLIPGTVADHVLMAQLVLAALTIGLLPVAAAITERGKLRDEMAAALTESKATAAALRESEERFRLMAENASDILIRNDIRGRISYLGPSVKRITGYEPEELVGRLSQDLIYPADRQRVMDAMVAMFKARQPIMAEPIQYRLPCKDGRVLWIEARPTMLRDENGKVTAIFDNLRDVTERKTMEAELIAARVAAESAAAAKTAFLANMSHEIRTPLTSVIGFADLLHDNCDLEPRARKYAERVRDASRVLLSTINDILDYSKLESGHVELAPEPVNVRAHAEDLLALFGPQAGKKGVALSFACDAGADEVKLMLDPQRLRQVLLNLVGNAVKFTDAGHVTLSVETVETNAATRTLRWRVADTGPGIAPDMTAQLFQRFSQGDVSMARRHGGTGLGLAICKSIVEAMGGEIGVNSEVGRGSVFWFMLTLPVAEVARPTSEAPESSAPVAQRKTRVLIVDDTEPNRALVRAVLGTTGVAMAEAASGEAAVRLAAAQRFDLILMDVQMPGMDGIAAMRAIRAGGASSRARIVAFTAEGDQARLDALLAQGFDAMLSKPIVIPELLRCVTMKTADAAPAAARQVA